MHSGDSACVLPAQSLSGAASAEISEIVKRLGPALGVVGLLNVQLAVVDDEVFVLEVNPRASRTVPFASKATGVNLVAAACRLAAGEKIADLDAARRAPAAPGERQGGCPAVRALPGRRPGARPGDARDRRGDGERQRPADGVREGRARRGPLAAARRLGVPLGARGRQGGGGSGRCRARRARLPARRDERARRARCAPRGSRSRRCAR